MVARVVTLVGSIITVPLLIGYLGQAGYGIWVTAIALTAWVGLAHVGLQPSLLGRLAGIDPQDRDLQSEYVATAWWMSLGLGLVTLVALALLGSIDGWGGLLEAPQSLAIEARVTVTVMWIGVAVAMPLSIPLVVIRSAQDVHIASLIEAAGVAAKVTAIFVVVTLDLGLEWLVIGAVFAPLVVWGLAIPRTFGQRVRWPWRYLVRVSLGRRLIRPGIGFTAMAVAGLLFTSTDPIIISYLLGPSSVATYSVAFALLLLFVGLEGAVLDAMWPAYADAAAKSDRPWIERTHREVTRWSLAASAVFAVGLVFLGRQFISVWAGPAAVPPDSLLVVLGVTAVVISVEFAHNRLLVALGHIRKATLIAMLGASINVPASILLGNWLGVTGVALGTLCAYIVVTSIVVLRTRTALAAVGGPV